jgi:hypothetical protein
MLLIGGFNTVYAETGTKIDTVYMHKKSGESNKEAIATKTSWKKHNNKGWRKNS